MNPNDNKLRGILNEKMHDREIPPAGNLWDSISARLDEEQKPGGAWWQNRGTSLLALSALLIGAFTYLLWPDKNKALPNEQRIAENLKHSIGNTQSSVNQDVVAQKQAENTSKLIKNNADENSENLLNNTTNTSTTSTEENSDNQADKSAKINSSEVAQSEPIKAKQKTMPQSEQLAGMSEMDNNVSETQNTEAKSGTNSLAKNSVSKGSNALNKTVGGTVLYRNRATNQLTETKPNTNGKNNLSNTKTQSKGKNAQSDAPPMQNDIATTAVTKAKVIHPIAAAEAEVIANLPQQANGEIVEAKKENTEATAVALPSPKASSLYVKPDEKVKAPNSNKWFYMLSSGISHSWQNNSFTSTDEKSLIGGVGRNSFKLNGGFNISLLIGRMITKNTGIFSRLIYTLQSESFAAEVQSNTVSSYTTVINADGSVSYTPIYQTNRYEHNRTYGLLSLGAGVSQSLSNTGRLLFNIEGGYSQMLNGKETYSLNNVTEKSGTGLAAGNTTGSAYLRMGAAYTLHSSNNLKIQIEPTYTNFGRLSYSTATPLKSRSSNVGINLNVKF